jgi:hypothetical protein
MFSKPNDKVLINHKNLDKNLWEKNGKKYNSPPPKSTIISHQRATQWQKMLFICHSREYFVSLQGIPMA